MKYFHFIIIILIISNISFSQNEANVWYFGNHAGIDFNSGTPTALLDSQMATQEGCATISNSSGNLLFYTDGSTIWDASHNIMANGSGLNGHSSSTQSAIIVPKPNNSDIYYVFTVDHLGGNHGLQYSEVDMSLNTGLGAVTANKNIVLVTPVLEKLTAVKHANGIDYWVLAHKNGSAEFYAYLVTDTGISNTPVITDIGISYSGPTLSENAGYMKASPDGSKLAMVFLKYTNNIQLFDFDANTGVLSNYINFFETVGTSKPYSLEFSPSGQLLYVSGHGGVSQFDLSHPTVLDILLNTTVLQNNIPEYEWAALQLGPDGKIYVTREVFLNSDMPPTTSLSVIHHPDQLGISCDFELDAIDLQTGIARAGLPQFIQSFFNVPFEVENNCLGETTHFNASFPSAYDSILWDFGDGTTATIENPSHNYINPGTYTISLSVTSGGQTSQNSRDITIYEQPTATQPQDIIICDDNNDGFYNFDLTTQDIVILNGQDSATFDITYYASLTDYTNNNPIADFSNCTNAQAYTSQTIVASVKNVNNGDCEDTTTFNIDLFESPTPSTNIPNLSFCDNTSVGSDTDGIILFDLTQNETVILNGQDENQFTVSYYTDATYTNLINSPEAYQNSNTTETIYVEVTNDSYLNCVGQTSFDIEVYALPSVTPLVELRQCDDDLDGFSVFNLTEVNAELSTNFSNEIISYYETQMDAENATNAISNFSTYTNQTVSVDNIWARIENQNGCHKVSEIEIIVSTTQIPITLLHDFYECDDGIDLSDGISTFDFSSVNTQIQALFPAGQQLIINYYRNQADALSETNPILDITNYQNIGYPNQQDIFVRVDSALDNDCLGLGHHITLHVETVPIANSVIIDEQCDDDGDGMYAFDTSNIETILLNGQTNVDVAYFDGLGNPLSSPLPNPFLTATQTITARVTNSTSQDSDGACFDETQITFTVDAAAVAYTIPDFIECDDDNDGQFAFDTSNIETTVLNGQTGMNVIYTDENGSLLPSPLPNPFITSSQTITVRVENQLNSICYDETVFSFTVSEQPVANTINDLFVCDDPSNDGAYTFTLSSFNSEILDDQSPSVFEITYYEDEVDAQNNTNSLPNSYVVNSTLQSLYARIHNMNNPNCYDITSFQLGVHYLPIANEPENILVCDDMSNDGFEMVDLSIQNSLILGGQSASNTNLSYYISQADADNNINAIDENFTNTINPQTIYVRLENIDAPNCYTTTSFEIEVKQQPVLHMDEEWIICEGEFIEVIADYGYDEYFWSTGETGQSIIVDTAGTYEVTATNIYGDLSCSTSKTITVTSSNMATITSIETIDWTQNNNAITVFAEGDGDYEYSIDGITYQDSNEFSNLTIDEYIVYVRDKNGCGVVTESVYLLYYPRFFTPNNDGYNDTWQLINSIREPNNKVYIFDRYGKLLKQLKPIDMGWDGTHNGNKLPSSDYWFVLERQNGKTYRGHFSLKR